jgi:hypothetical protein
LEATEKDLGTLRSEVAAGQGEYCDNVFSVASDANYVDSDMNYLESDINGLTSDISSMNSDSQSVADVVQRLKADSVPEPSNAVQAVQAAKTAMASATQKANGYIDAVNSGVTAAYSIANGLAYGTCAGDGPGSPNLLKHL